MKKVLGTLGVIALSGAAMAQVSAVNIVAVDNSTAQGVGPFPTGFTTTDVLIDFAGQYTGSQILVELTSGSIVNPIPSNTPPNDTDPFTPLNPLALFDTYFANGGDRVSTTSGGFSLGGGPVNIDSTLAAPVITATTLAQAYNPSAGNFVRDRSDFLTLRLSLTGDANGTFTYFASANSIFETQTFEIVNGVVVPEPATAALLGLGALAMLRRRTA